MGSNIPSTELDAVAARIAGTKAPDPATLAQVPADFTPSQPAVELQPTVKERPTPDRGALSFVAHGVEMTETGGRHFDKDGKVITSPKGARGVMQLMEGTATDLGVNADDEAQNREGGTRLLGQLYDKYGNWPDSLAAYNAGAGRVDKWIADGRPASGKAALPEETQRYVPQVMARAGLEDTPASALLSRKRQLSQDELHETASSIANGHKVKLPGEEEGSLTDTISWAADAFFDPAAYTRPEFREQALTIAQGARKGVQNLFLGPLQLGLELTAPEAAASMTHRVNELEEQFGSKALLDKHPASAFVGEAIGIGGAIAATRGLLGSLAVPQIIARVTPMAVRGMLPAATGAALGATSYNPDPENTSRIVEGVLGAVAGEAGRYIGKASAWAARKIADKSAYNTTLASMQASVGELTRNAVEPVQGLLKHMEGLWATSNRNYASRNIAGRSFDGMDSAGLRGVVEGYTNETRVQGVAVAPAAKTYAGRVYEELGLKTDDAQRGAWQHTQREYEKELAEWQRTLPRIARDKGYQEAIIARRVAAGTLAPPPVAPPPFISEPVSSAQWSAALTAVNRGLRSVSRKDGAAIKQLTSLKDGLMRVAGEEATALGVSVDTFLRRSAQANKFYAENIAPLRDIFKTVNTSELARTLTPAKLFDAVVDTIQGGDTVKLAALAKAVGSRGQDDMRRMAMFQALNKGQEPGETFDPMKAVKWIRGNQESLQTLFGRQGVTEMLGWGQIAQRVTEVPSKFDKLLKAGSHSWLPWLGAWHVGRAVVAMGTGHGSPTGQLVEGATLLAAPMAIHAFFSLLSNAERVPGVMPMVRRAGQLRPGSAELDGLIQAIQSRYQSFGATMSRLGAEQYAQP